ncbi:MAG: hypothetical protein IRZ08_08935 [Frankia sp.]|nr:hypothetical protein [Frankia sp.]
MSESVPELVREINRLLGRLRGWSPTAWDVAATAGGTRAERTRALAADLARLGRLAGSGAPAGAEPPRLAPHGLADQIVVLADDLLRALGEAPPARRDELARQAREVVAAARSDLEGVGFGFRPHP